MQLPSRHIHPMGTSEETYTRNDAPCDDAPPHYSRVNTDESLHEFSTAVDKAKDCIVDILADAEGGDGHGRNSALNALQI